MIIVTPIALLCVLILFFAPVQLMYFVSDDFNNLSHAATCLDWLTCVVEPVATSHFSPLLRFLFLLEFAVFGEDPSGYYAVNIIFHLSTTALASWAVFRLTGNTISACAFILLFGLSEAHWRVPLWITTQGQMMAACFLLLCLHSSLSYARSGRLGWILTAISMQFFATLSFTTGLLFWIVVPLILLATSWGKDSAVRKRCVRLSASLASTVLVYLLLRMCFVEGDWPDKPGAPETLVGRVQMALAFLASGYWNAVFSSYSGIKQLLGFFGIGPLDPFIALLLISFFLVVLSVFVRAAVPKADLSENLQLVFALILASVLLYILPIFPRLAWGIDWFITRPRYVYVPGVFLCAAFSIIIGLINTRRPNNFPVRAAVVIAFATAVGINAHQMLFRIGERVQSTAYLRSEVEMVIQRLSAEHSALEKELCVVDGNFSSTPLAWNVTVKDIVEINLPTSTSRRIRYLDQMVSQQDCAVTIDLTKAGSS